MLRSLLLGLLSLTLAGCSVIGVRSGYEQPEYEVIDRIGDNVEIRRYAPRVAAGLEVEAADESSARAEAFRILADYISGANRAEAEVAMTTPVAVDVKGAEGQRIAMTTPVETEAAGEGRYAMRFFLPRTYTKETVPAPTDPRVAVEARRAETLAVLRFSGRRDSARLADKTAALRRALEGSEWRPETGAAPVAFLYDPPWTLPFLRRNEVAIPVARSEDAQ